MNRKVWLVVGVVLAGTVALLVQACARPESASQPPVAPRDGYRVVQVYPHDPEAFTQGLLYRDGFLYESTGLNGRSSLRKVKLETGEVLQRQSVDAQHFAEGLTDWDDRLFQLTWKSNVGFVYDFATFQLRDSFVYPGEGWGLTRDRNRLIMSDGTSALRFLDPKSLQETSRLSVKDGGLPVSSLNELEFVQGEIYANVWPTDRIVRISPATGQVTGWVDLDGLLGARGRGEDVLNGIAYDAEKDRLFVTGKLWPRLFEIKLVRRQ